MAVLSTNEEIASRFAPYLKELQEVFALHSVPFGTPADLPGAVDRLERSGSFAEDVSSILRSMILREGGTVPQTELLEVLALAAAGPSLDPALPEVQPAFRGMLSFVGNLVRRPWNVPPGEIASAPLATAETAPAAPPEAAVAYAALAEPEQPAEAEQPAEPSQPEHPPLAAPPEAPQPAPAAELVPPSRSSSQSSLPPGYRPFAPRVQAEEHEAPASAEIPPPRRSRSDRNPARALWVAAACAILAVLALIFFDRTHSAPNASNPVVSPPISGASTNAGNSAIGAVPDSTKRAAATPYVAGRQAAAPARGQRSLPPGTYGSAQPSQAGTYLGQPGSQPGTQQANQSRSAESAPTAAGPSTPAAPPAYSSPASPYPGTQSSSPPTPSASTPSYMRHPAIALPRRDGHGAYFQVSSGVMASHLVRSADPGYPILARVAHIQGQVILQAVISTEGEVVATHVLSGHHLLRSAAAAAVKKWRYRPFMVDGRPVNVATIVTVEFHDQR